MFLLDTFTTQPGISEAQENLMGLFPAMLQEAVFMAPLLPSVSRLTPGLPIFYHVSVATGPSAHGLRWTKPSPLDLR